MAHKTVSCSFADCRSPSYARWLRQMHLLYDEPVNTTFLACREHDDRLQRSRELSVHKSIMRIGLYQDEVCFHDPYVLRSQEFTAEPEGEL